jgi:hypothetical protein
MMYRNNRNEALMKIIKFIHNKGDTHMILGIPHRLHLVEYSCVNGTIQVFNYKLKKPTIPFDYVAIMECNDKEYFTTHIILVEDQTKVNPG